MESKTTDTGTPVGHGRHSSRKRYHLRAHGRVRAAACAQSSPPPNAPLAARDARNALRAVDALGAVVEHGGVAVDAARRVGARLRDAPHRLVGVRAHRVDAPAGEAAAERHFSPALRDAVRVHVLSAPRSWNGDGALDLVDARAARLLARPALRERARVHVAAAHVGAAPLEPDVTLTCSREHTHHPVSEACLRESEAAPRDEAALRPDRRVPMRLKCTRGAYLLAGI